MLYSGHGSYLFVNRNQIYKFKADNKNVNTEEVSLKENAYDLWVDYDAIHKSDILNIHMYLMIKNNIK